MTPCLSTMKYERCASLRSASNTPYAWVVFPSGKSETNGKLSFRKSAKAFWENGWFMLTPMISVSAAVNFGWSSLLDDISFTHVGVKSRTEKQIGREAWRERV